MCIIAIKPAGTKLPEEKIIERMWNNNDDGAGMMYPSAGKVQIDKGYMTYDAFKGALEKLSKSIDTTATPIILHFRIGTSGGNTPENTHPFPICESLGALKKLRIKTTLGVAHNGMIDIIPRKKEMSDTMEYIISQLAPLQALKRDFYKDNNGQKLVYNATGSKLAFLDGQGHIETVGKFLEDDGILYSNDSYKYARFNYDISDFYPYYSSDSSARRLVYFNEGEAYVIFEDGSTADAVDYMMDKQGRVYGVEDDYSSAYTLPAEIFDINTNKTPKFKDSSAFPMYII